MADNGRLLFNDAEILSLAKDAAVRRELLAAGGDVADIAADDAPKRTGAGARSIRPEAVEEDGAITVRVSWDRAHYYLFFHQHGTKYLPANPFLTEALDQYARLGVAT